MLLNIDTISPIVDKAVKTVTKISKTIYNVITDSPNPEIESLKLAQMNLSQKVDWLQNNFSSLNAILTKLGTPNQSNTNAKIEAIQNQIKAIQEFVNKSPDKNNTLELNVDSMKSDLSNLKLEFKSIEQDLEKQQTKINQLESNANAIDQNLKKVQNKVDVVNDSLKNVQDTVADVDQSLNQVEQDMNAIEEIVQQGKNEVTQLKTEMDEKILSLDGRLYVSENRMDEMERLLNSFMSQFSDYTASNDAKTKVMIDKMNLAANGLAFQHDTILPPTNDQNTITVQTLGTNDSNINTQTDSTLDMPN